MQAATRLSSPCSTNALSNTVTPMFACSLGRGWCGWRRGGPGQRRAPVIHIAAEGIGGPAELDWAFFGDYLASFLRDERRLDVRRKLAITGSDERPRLHRLLVQHAMARLACTGRGLQRAADGASAVTERDHAPVGVGLPARALHRVVSRPWMVRPTQPLGYTVIAADSPSGADCEAARRQMAATDSSRPLPEAEPIWGAGGTAVDSNADSNRAGRQHAEARWHGLT